ncbi:MAG: sulfatase-like hydrolase/transferase, partial [Chlamydiota bacterium]
LQSQKTPTFLTLFTITNHHPWIHPPPQAQGNPYFGTFSYTDWALQLFIEDLREKKLLEKSILFIFGDHGQELSDRDPYFEINRHLYQENVHVPLLIYAEGRVKQPKQIDTVSSQIDLLPTLLDLLQIPGPHHSLGKSLLRPSNAPIFFDHPFNEAILGCRQGDWKLLLQESGDELYDLRKDPGEKKNLILENPETAQELKRQIIEFKEIVDELYENRSFSEKIVEKASKGLHLDFSHSLQMTDVFLEKTALSHPDLASLTLAHCLLITDAGIASLLKHCPRIEKLNLEGLDEITGEGWGDAPQLMHLKAIHCPRFSGEPMAKWVKNLPSLTILELGSATLSDKDL